MFTSGFLAPKKRAVRVPARANSAVPRSSSTAHTSGIGAGEEGEEDTVENPFDEGLHAKKASVLSFGSRKQVRKEMVRTIFQIEEMTNSLRSGSQTDEEEVLKPLKASK